MTVKFDRQSLETKILEHTYGEIHKSGLAFRLFQN